MKNTIIPITESNLIFAEAELNFTHDHSKVEVGSIMYSRDGIEYRVTKIDKDECGNKRYWENDSVLTIQYTSPHNMLTKQPFFAHEFIVKK